MVALISFLLCARIACAAPPCAGDCNSDGLVGIDELITGVQVSLSGDADTCGADLDDDGGVAVNELVRLVGLALSGCPLPFDAAAIDGVYDADAQGQTDPSGGFNKRGVAVIEVGDGGLRIDGQFGALETFHLQGGALPDGSIELIGDGTQSGEFALLITGVMRFVQRDGAVELVGELDFKLTFAPGPFRLDVVFARRLGGTAARYGGVQRLTLRHPVRPASPLTGINLPLSVPRSGRATCGAATDRVPDGTSLAELPASACLVSPSGRFLYAAPYAAPDGATPLPLHLTGTISDGAGTVGRGTFYVAEFPQIAESGVWESERVDAASP